MRGAQCPNSLGTAGFFMSTEVFAPVDGYLGYLCYLLDSVWAGIAKSFYWGLQKSHFFVSGSPFECPLTKLDFLAMLEKSLDCFPGSRSLCNPQEYH